jgi:ribosomal protein S18 acetylase RimI-like enzyme
MISIRRSVPADQAGVRRIVNDVWDQDVRDDSFHTHLQAETHSLWVAEAQGEIVGFVSAFMTRARGGQTRWEIDLIAVEPAYQGQGIGAKLIANIYRDGQVRGADLARALIRVDNLPSQRAFSRIGFSSDGEIYQLLIWTPQPGADRPCPDQVALLPVDALTYRGLWIEGLDSLSRQVQRRTLEVARAVAAAESCDNTGTVFPARQVEQLPPQFRAEADLQGRYVWFNKLISEHPSGESR